MPYSLFTSKQYHCSIMTTKKGTQHILLICFLLSCSCCFCQNKTDRWFQLRIAPLNVLDPVTSVIQTGVEKRFGARMALSFDYGLRSNRLFFASKSVHIDYRYHKYKAEFKYFFKTSNRHQRLTDNSYISVQGFYLPQHYRKENSWLWIGDKSYHYDYSNISRKVWVASVLLGNESTVGRWVLDVYGGFGVRQIILQHQPFHTVESRIPERREWSPLPLDINEGTFYRPHIASGLKVGYILNR